MARHNSRYQADEYAVVERGHDHVVQRWPEMSGSWWTRNILFEPGPLSEIPRSSVELWTAGESVEKVPVLCHRKGKKEQK